MQTPSHGHIDPTLTHVRQASFWDCGLTPSVVEIVVAADVHCWQSPGWPASTHAVQTWASGPAMGYTVVADVGVNAQGLGHMHITRTGPLRRHAPVVKCLGSAQGLTHAHSVLVADAAGTHFKHTDETAAATPCECQHSNTHMEPQA
jgi:hypothetical protein